MKLNQKSLAAAVMRKQALHANINAADAATAGYAPAFTGDNAHGVITQLNADLITEGTYRESLTTFAVGYRVLGLDSHLEAHAPAVQVARRFDYKTHDNAESFYSELGDDMRAPRADFKEVEYTSEEVNGKTINRGLMVSVDSDQVKDNPNWEQLYVGRLIHRLRLNQLRRAVNLLSAAAVNVNRTWDATPGKNPDGDVRDDIRSAANASGVRPNRVSYGPTAWSLRQTSHEAQDNAGGYAAAARDELALARYLAVEQVITTDARYATTPTAKAEVLANLVLLFNATSGATVEDSSNIKRFWSPCDNGQELMVHRWDVGPKKHCIAVELNELMRITSTLGIRKLTIS